MTNDDREFILGVLDDVVTKLEYLDHNGSVPDGLYERISRAEAILQRSVFAENTTGQPEPTDWHGLFYEGTYDDHDEKEELDPDAY